MYKWDAVALGVERGYAARKVAERQGINTKSLYKWKAQFATSPRVISEMAEQATEATPVVVKAMEATLANLGT